MTDKSGTSPTAVSLPSGGGAAGGLGDSVRVDPRRGVASYKIGIVCPPGRGDLTPQVALSYDSSAGFGPAGLGWTVPVRRITRRSDLAVPTFSADDVLTVDGQELLDVGGGEYRPRVDRAFERIRQVGDGWQIDGPDGRTYRLGDRPGARLADPGDPAHVHTWFLTEISDGNGNVVEYHYRRDDRPFTSGTQSWPASEVYLDRIEYNPLGDPGGASVQWAHTIRFLYDYDQASGPMRPDARVSPRCGFMVCTGFRLTAVEIDVDVPNEFSGPIRRYDLAYIEESDSHLALVSGVTVTGYDEQGNGVALSPATFGYSSLDLSQVALRDLEGAPHADLAAGNVEFVDLTANGLPDILSTVVGSHTFWLNNRWRDPSNLTGQHDFASGTLMTSSPNSALSDPATYLAGIRTRMAADLLTGQAVYDSPSTSATHSDILARRLRWGSGSTQAIPAFGFNDGKTRTVDLTGSGRMDVLRADGQFHHWLCREDGSFVDRGFSAGIPGLSFASNEWTLADMNGDGLLDIVHLGNGSITYYLNLAAGARTAPLFATSPITMGNSAALGKPASQWNPARLLLFDVNGDGYADAIYLYADHLEIYINQAGQSWSPVKTVSVPVTSHGVALLARASVRVVDVEGHGTPGLLCTGSGQPMRYLSLDSGTKPLLLTSVDNGQGGRMDLEYVSSAVYDGREWVTRMPFPLHLVKQVTTTDTVTGVSSVTRHVFLDGEYDMSRREFLGFAEHWMIEEGASDGSCETRSTVTTYHSGLTASTDPLERARTAALAGLAVRQAVAGANSAQPITVQEWGYLADAAPRFDQPGVGAAGSSGLTPRSSQGIAIAEPVATALACQELNLHYDPADPRAGRDRGAALGGTLRTTVYRDSAGRLDPYGRALSITAVESLTVVPAGTPLPAGTAAVATVDPTAAMLADALAAQTSTVATLAAAPADQRASQLTYATDVANHRAALTARRLTRAGGAVIEDVRHYYDGPDYVGLPLGLVGAGNLSRQEVLVLRQDQVNQAYSDWPGGVPDLNGLGYHYGEYGTRRLIQPPWWPKLPQRPPIEPSRPLELAGATAVAGAVTRAAAAVAGAAATLLDQVIDGRLGRLVAEGYGYFIDAQRQRYARLPGGALAYGHVAGRLDPAGNERTYDQDAAWLFTVTERNPAGETVTSVPDYRSGRMASVTDANAQTQQNRYDALGRLTAVIKPGDSDALPTLSYTYSPAGDVPAWVRTGQRETSGAPQTFDTVEYVDGFGRTLQTRVEGEQGTTIVSAAHERNVRGGVRTRVMPYRAASMAYAAPPASALRITRAVDALEREVALGHPDGSRLSRRITGLLTDEFDREDSDPVSPHAQTPTRTIHDTRGNLLAVHQRLGTRDIGASYTYDALGQLAEIRTDLGSTAATVRYRRDLLGRIIRVEHADAGPLRLVYGPAGELRQRCDGRGATVAQDYDAAGRLLCKRFPSTAASPVQYQYGQAGTTPSGACAVGRLWRVTDAAGTVELGYGSRGELLRWARTWDEHGTPRTHEMTFARDAADRLIATTYPALDAEAPMAVACTYSEANLLGSVALSAPTVQSLAAFEYDERGQRTEVQHGNGLITTLRYHAASHRLVEVATSTGAGAAVRHHAYGHDRESNLTVDADLVAHTAAIYDYDDLYRLVRARTFDVGAGTLPVAIDALDATSGAALVAALAAAPTADESYSYTDGGDVLALGGAGAVTYQALASRPHGELQSGGQSYRFDEAGLLNTVLATAAGKTVASLEYDAEGRLHRCAVPAADLVAEYTYDYEGERTMRRVTRISTGALVGETRWLGRWVTLEAAPGAAGWSDVRQYVLDGRETLAVADAHGSLQWLLHGDHLANCVMLSDPAGNAQPLAYSPFGVERSAQTCPWLHRRFAGRETDPPLDGGPSLVDFGSRQYLPAIGRWTAPDPDLWSAPETRLANPQNLNAYAYAVNNPLTLTDPTGRAPDAGSGDVVDTRRTVTTVAHRPDGVPETTTARVIEGKPGTAHAKTSADFGVRDDYHKQQGAGGNQPFVTGSAPVPQDKVSSQCRREQFSLQGQMVGLAQMMLDLYADNPVAKTEETVLVGIGNVFGQAGATVTETVLGLTLRPVSLFTSQRVLGELTTKTAWEVVQQAINPLYREIWTRESFSGQLGEAFKRQQEQACKPPTTEKQGGTTAGGAHAAQQQVPSDPVGAGE